MKFIHKTNAVVKSESWSLSHTSSTQGLSGAFSESCNWSESWLRDISASITFSQEDFLFGFNFRYELPELHDWFQRQSQHGAEITSEIRDHRALGDEVARARRRRSDIVRRSFESMPRHQVTVTGPKGVISIIQAGVSFGAFEIYCIEGILFKDIRRYGRIDETGRTVISLLVTGEFLNEEDDYDEDEEDREDGQEED